MERHVKERLVGAAVLMAAAVILIPEMLSGPDRASQPVEARAVDNAALKTYTIDLQQPEGDAASAPIPERAPPPPEALTSSDAAAESRTEPQANPEVSANEAAVDTVASQSNPPSVASTGREETGQAAPSIAQPAAPAPSPQKVARARGWAVQIGSFSRQASAERLASELKSAGHAAFVMPVQTGASTLYRVRVGPMDDRPTAEAALRTLKTKAPGAAVVAHP